VTKSQKQEKIDKTSDGAAIISGIETDALSEEKQIIQEAETQAAEKRSYADKKVESLLDEARKDAQEQAEKAKKKIISGVQLELKRRSLNVRGEVMRHITDKVEHKLNSMVSDTNYRSVLVNWITEAAIGLDKESAQINASEKELVYINDQLIAEVTERIRQKTGRVISLKLSKEPSLNTQGVILTADDGRTAFNNQVKTRLLRKEREIRMAIYDALFTDKRKE
jgi:vacuolar-type H+-ATPase subunit E/Vma4